jgi:hypothetical protein
MVPSGAEWLVTLDSIPVADSPAVALDGLRISGTVADIRWHGKAGLTKATRQQWRQKPGRA